MGWGLPLKKVWQTLWKRSWGNVSIPLLAVAARDVRVLSVWDPKNDESPSCPHPRILLRIVMPWGGWCLMKDSDSGQQTLMIWMGWFNSRMMLIWDLGWCKSESAKLWIGHGVMCFASETFTNDKCQPESMNQIYPSQQSKCLGVFSKTHFSRISRAKEFSKENQNLLFLVTAPWTWNMTLPLSFFPTKTGGLTPILTPRWGSWRSCGLALGLVPLDSWMGLYEWGTELRNGWTFSERGFQVRWGCCGEQGNCPDFCGHHEYETNNSILGVLRCESSSNNSQQSSIFCKGKYILFVHELSHFFVDDKAIEVFINAVNIDEPWRSIVMFRIVSQSNCQELGCTHRLQICNMSIM